MNKEIRSWFALIKYHAQRTLFTGVAWLFAAIAILALLFVVIGVQAVDLEGGVIWSVFGRDVPQFFGLVAMIIMVAFGLLIRVFLPIGISHRVTPLIEPPFAQYVLTRPVSRTQGVLTHLAGVACAYTVLIGSVLGLLWLVFWGKGNHVGFLLWPGFLYVPVSVAIHAFLLAFVVGVRSKGVAMTVTVGYTMLASSYVTERVSDDVWLSGIINGFLSVLYWCLPPVHDLTRVMGNHSVGFGSTSPDVTGVHILLMSLLSTALFASLSVWFYRRLEF